MNPRLRDNNGIRAARADRTQAFAHPVRLGLGWAPSCSLEQPGRPGEASRIISINPDLPRVYAGWVFMRGGVAWAVAAVPRTSSR